ncbi:hypothetical protein AcW1_004468 [Taiwanofungus camphoratus]|nr:hypothetical protein AcW2_006527 [Antrodia cinnamomea]KAI0939416.1 hypothetical protein AcV5_000843 [Antrodia cinnamomea]KAI0952341.1 hypothetical protein AcV7_008183 [Antrodia cinnamomea]KAI0959724.1 hypothetical protein AcW1_004468 [Antrodia cinnamomea]
MIWDSMLWNLLILPLACTSFSSVGAQFNFFEQMFGHPGQQQQQQQQQQRSSGSTSAGQWMLFSDSVSCSQYLCPDTLVCVSSPTDCPCPDVQDIRCLLHDTGDRGAATVMCVRGMNECADVERLARKLG